MPNKYNNNFDYIVSICIFMEEYVIDTEAENKEIRKRYRALLRACKPTLQKGDKQQIRKAFDLDRKSVV